MHLTGPPSGTMASSAHSAFSRALAIAAWPLAVAWRLMSRRRLLAAAGSLSLTAAAFASGVAGPAAPASADVLGTLCLTYYNYCLAYYPGTVGYAGSGSYGVASGSCNDENDCSWYLASDGYWDADGVSGDEYLIEAVSNRNYCLANTAITSSGGSLPDWAPCGANGTVWVADDDGGNYLVSRYVLDHDPPSSLSNASIILVNTPSEYPTPTIGFEWQTGGAVFGRWNITPTGA